MRAEDRYDSLLQWYCQAHGMDWRYAKAQMLVESAANPTAVSSAGARGLFQFMRRTWLEWFDGTPGIQGEPTVSPENPEAAIQRRCDYMAWLLVQCDGDLEQATGAYNWGIGNVKNAVRRWGPGLWSTVAPKETRDYLTRIQRRYAALQTPVPERTDDA